METRDANCRGMSSYLRVLSDEGVDVSGVCEGLPVTVDDVMMPGTWLDWPTAATIIDRLELLAGGPDGFCRLATQCVPDVTNRFYSRLVTMVVEPAQLYRMVAKVIAPAICPYHQASFEKISSQRLLVELSLPESGIGSRAFFYGAKGTFIALPQILDLGRAEVDASIQPHKATFRIDVPRSKTLWSRTRRRLASFRAAEAALEELDSQQRQLSENHQELRQAYEALKVREAELTEQIAERERVQKALSHQEIEFRQAQKMEALGKLSGGIAHDFNNQLTVILGYADFILQATDLETAKGYAEKIQASAMSSSSLTTQLLAFARRQMLRPKVLDLNELLAKLDDMFRRTLGEDIDLDFIRAGGLGRVRADPGQLEQALLNLVINAREAIGARGGHLTIETANVYLDRQYVEAHPSLEPGRYVMLAVSDDGPGMPEELRATIFEPFFTTKPSGTGLGLSMVQGFVAQSGGVINVYSEPGVGTTLKIYLPRVGEAREAETLDDDQPIVDLARGTETILIVEDEALLCELVTRILTRHGYTAMSAANGPEALELSRAREPQLVLTDVVMPEMSGAELVARLRESQPDLPAIYMSGYTENAIVHRGELDAGIVLVQKPFTTHELLGVIRSTLNKRLPG